MPARPSSSFWAGKRVLLTGQTGFKGGWLSLWLSMLGARVWGIGLPPVTRPALFDAAGVGAQVRSYFCDIRESSAAALIHDIRPEIVLHLAAQPLVREGYRQPLETFSSNVMGTAQVLDALRGLGSVRVVVVATTDKVYRNPDHGGAHCEDDPLGGHDPYSASKAASEIVAACYRDAFLAEQGVALATVRAGNVIGGGDWSADRLIPDAVRAWSSGAALSIRRPDSTRPWQHVLEPLSGYLVLAEQLWADACHAGSWNFGPASNESASVRTVIELARSAYGRGEIAWGDGNDGPHEAASLALDTSKAKLRLDIASRWNLQETIGRTMRWYRRWEEGADAKALCEADIQDFEATA